MNREINENLEYHMNKLAESDENHFKDPEEYINSLYNDKIPNFKYENGSLNEEIIKTIKKSLILIYKDHVSSNLSSSLSSFSIKYKFILHKIIAYYEIHNMMNNKEKAFYLIIPSLSFFLYYIIANKDISKEEKVCLLNIHMENKVEISSNLISSILDFYVKEYNIDNALDIFYSFLEFSPKIIFSKDFLFEKNKINLETGVNIVCYTNIINHLYKNNRLHKANEISESTMNNKDLEKNEIYYNVIINGNSNSNLFSDNIKIYSIYEKMIQNKIKPNKITNNIMLKAYLKLENIEKSIEIIKNMINNKDFPDRFTYSTLFSGIKNKKYKELFNLGVSSYDKYIRNNKNINNNDEVYIINKIIEASLKINHSFEFRILFQKLNEYKNYVELNIVSVNTLIKACTTYEFYDKGIEIFNSTKELNLIRNEITYNSIIYLCIKAKWSNKIVEYLREMEEENIFQDEVTYSTIIKSFDKFNIDSAFIIFEKAKNKFNHINLDSIYNSMMDYLVNIGKFDHAYSIYEEMIYKNIPISDISKGIIMKIYLYEPLNAMKIFDEEIIVNKSPSIILLGSIINICIKNNIPDKAIDYYNKGKEMNIKFNSVIYTTIINAYAIKRDLNSIYKLYKIMYESLDEEVQLNNIAFNTILDIYVKENKLSLARKFLNEMNNYKKNEVFPELISYSILIKGYLYNNNHYKAIATLKEMTNLNIIPDSNLLNSLLINLNKGEILNEAIKVFGFFEKYQVNVNQITISTMLKIFGKSKDMFSSKATFNLSKDLGLCNMIIYTCYIKSCYMNSSFKEACRVFDELLLNNYEDMKLDNKCLITFLKCLMYFKKYLLTLEYIIKIEMKFLKNPDLFVDISLIISTLLSFAYKLIYTFERKLLFIEHNSCKDLINRLNKLDIRNNNKSCITNIENVCIKSVGKNQVGDFDEEIVEKEINENIFYEKIFIDNEFNNEFKIEINHNKEKEKIENAPKLSIQKGDNMRNILNSNVKLDERKSGTLNNKMNNRKFEMNRKFLNN